MSSYYTLAQIEARRRELLKQELARSIQALKAQLQNQAKGVVQPERSANVRLSVLMPDTASTGFTEVAPITGDMLGKNCAQAPTQREELDCSGLLHAGKNMIGKTERALSECIRQIEERPLLSEQDERDHKRLLGELSGVLDDKDMDVEDKLRFAQMRVTSYLQCGARRTPELQEKMETAYLDYCALCQMLEVKPTEFSYVGIQREVERMTAVLEKRREDDYIMEVIHSIMGELGCHAGEDAVLDHTMGQMYSVDGHPLCDVFVGTDSSGIMFEPVGTEKGGSLEQQRQMEHSANSICELYGQLEKRAAEQGVILKRIYQEPARMEHMAMRADISTKGAKKRRQAGAAKKARTFNEEG